MIEIRDLTKYYGTVKALEDVSFDVPSGQITALLGLNGAGKTTCLRILTGYLFPTSGSVKIEGKDVFSDSMDTRSQIGYLPEVPPLYPELTVHDYLQFVARLRGVREDQFQVEFDKIAEKTRINSVRDSLIRHLSLGFRKRVGIAQALIGSPAVVILDEPISGLDPRQIVEMRGLIRSLSGDHTILLSSHILGEVANTCDRVIILHQGRVAGSLAGAEMTGLENKFMELTGGLPV